MKPVLAILATGIVAWILVFRVSDDTERSYVVVKVSSETTGRLDMTFVQKLPAGVTCSQSGEDRGKALVQDLTADCPECKTSKPRCKDELIDLYRRAFENQPLGRPYFSYDKGWNLGSESFRVFFDDPDPARGSGLCETVRRQLRNDMRYFMNGHFGCIWQ